MWRTVIPINKILALLLILFSLQSMVTQSHAAQQAADDQQSTHQDELLLTKQIIEQIQQQPSSTASPSQSGAATSSDAAAAASVDYSITQLKLPALNAPVIDQANLLSSTQRQQLSDKILQIYQAGKAQIGVIIVASTGQEAIFDYAMRIADQWQLGSAKHDNGLLIVVAVQDRRIQILTGYGLEGVLPDVVNYQIIQNKISPYFKQADYATGIDAGLTEIDRILSLDPEIAKQQADVLKAQQQQAHRQQQAQSSVLQYSIGILIVAVLASIFIGRKLASVGAAVAGVAVGLFSGLGLGTSLVIGLGLFVLIISSIAQLILHAVASGAGGRFDGGSGGGGYSGGGGGFGGGGASGSW